MESTFNPVTASESIMNALERYLASTFNPRRQVLAEEYAAALQAAKENGDLGGSLFREVRRKFASGKPLQELMELDGIHPDLLNFMEHPPYVHQARALELAATDHRNVVVATGTGSGKTESFLMPIVSSLLTERDAGELTAGVRAVLVYPMNALAQDQLVRIRKSLEKFPDITFGRFVGPTFDTTTEAIRENNGKPYQSNERPSREAIIEDPPHILITNYAMLERLLLLPKWAGLFTGDLKWLVLDEVHSYDGTKGIEISLLLRRLKARTGSKQGVQCIAASATLGNGSREDLIRAAEFATNLFGEPFESEDVILPTYDADSPEVPPIDVFAPDQASRVDEYRNETIGNYHLFVRNPGGTFICLSSKHPTGSPRLRLQAGKWCEACEGHLSRLIELGACRTCGIEYLIAKIVGDEIFAVEEFDDAARYFRFLSAEIHEWPKDQQTIRDSVNEDSDEVAQSPTSNSKWICLSCATLNTNSTCVRCSSSLEVEVSEELSPDSAGHIRCNRCNSKGGRSPFGPIQRPVSGVDALTSVIATALYEHLPYEVNPDEPSGKRKLLAFSDNRQDAAYFAPYLEDSYLDILRRRAIIHAANRLADSDALTSPYGLQNLTAEIQRQGGELGQNSSDGAWQWAWLRGELVSVDSQQSLSGTGLINWFVPEANLAKSISVLVSQGLSEVASWELLNALLETVLYDGAIELPVGVSASDPIFAPKETQTKIYKIGKRPSNSAVAWISEASVGNKRTDMIARAFNMDSKAKVAQFLSEIWDALIVDGLFKDEGSGQKSISNSVLRFTTLSKGHLNSQKWCPVCRRYSWWILPNGGCVTKNCLGKPVSKDADLNGHYRFLYEHLPRVPLVAKEHTAQWTPTKALEIQDEFIKGEVNVLSCSTTFEMGVDIGEVVAVLCRNVPPTPANYVQRAGRAGRRAGDRSLVVTFARKRSHDAQFIADPLRLIRGRVPVPIINLENFDLIRRHVYALALSEYLRAFNLPGETAFSFFGRMTAGGDSPAESFVAWLKTKPEVISKTIGKLNLPANAIDSLGISDWSWVDLLVAVDATGRGAWLRVLQNLVESEDSEIVTWIEQLKQEIAAGGNSMKNAAKQLIRADNVQNNLRKRQMVELLANGGILPKYGFPVDVATLTPTFSALKDGLGTGLELSRDLSVALTEYAPGNEIVAGGQILKSVAVRKPFSVDFDFGSLRWISVTCNRCGWFFHTRLPDDSMRTQIPQDCGNCSMPLAGQDRVFLEPRFGFLASVDRKSAGSKSRPRKIAFARTYLSTVSGSDDDWEIFGTTISKSVSRDARLLTLSTVNYWFCSTCGYASPLLARSAGVTGRMPRSHLDCRTDKTCLSTSPLQQTTFGHQYVTDVLRMELRLMNVFMCSCGDSQCMGAYESAAAALVGAAVRMLGVSGYDLASSVNSTQLGQNVRLTIFDTTPGGAGLSQALNLRLVEALALARDLVQNCTNCSLDSSCYSCIRTYTNQWRHEHLTREAALAVLSAVEPGINP